MNKKYPIVVILILLCCLFIFIPVWAQKTLTVGEVTAEPGEKKSGFIIVPKGEDGPETIIPITLINGKKPGPVLALTAAIHGYESIDTQDAQADGAVSQLVIM